MLPHKHFIFGFGFALALFLLFPQINLIEATLILLASFLIDFDHYLYYAYTHKELSLGNAYKWYIKKGKIILAMPKKERKKFRTAFCIFHGIEIPIILFLLSFFIHSYFYFILIAVVFHLVLDIYAEIKDLGAVRKLSVIYDFLTRKKLKSIVNTDF
jgi:hypothetical protein